METRKPPSPERLAFLGLLSGEGYLLLSQRAVRKEFKKYNVPASRAKVIDFHEKKRKRS